MSSRDDGDAGRAMSSRDEGDGGRAMSSHNDSDGGRAWTSMEFLRMLQKEEDEHERSDERREQHIKHAAQEEPAAQAAHVLRKRLAYTELRVEHGVDDRRVQIPLKRLRHHVERRDEGDGLCTHGEHQRRMRSATWAQQQHEAGITATPNHASARTDTT